jgi:hypothetical protein
MLGSLPTLTYPSHQPVRTDVSAGRYLHFGAQAYLHHLPRSTDVTSPAIGVPTPCLHLHTAYPSNPAVQTRIARGPMISPALHV